MAAGPLGNSFMFFENILFIFKSRANRNHRWRIFFSYLKLSFKNQLSKKIKFKTEKFLGYRVKFLSYRSFYAMFVDIFIRNCYYFKTEKSTPFIIDGGSNIGLVTLYFKFIYPESRVISFEPFGPAFKILETNIQLNKLKKVELVNSALADNNNSQAKIFYSQNRLSGTGNSLNKQIFEVKSKKGNEQIEELTISTVKLSDYLNEEVDLVKLDVEANELKVIKELQSSGKLTKLVELIFEYHYNPAFKENQLSEVIDLLENNNFKILIYRVDHDFNIYDFKKRKSYHYIILAFRGYE